MKPIGASQEQRVVLHTVIVGHLHQPFAVRREGRRAIMPLDEDAAPQKIQEQGHDQPIHYPCELGLSTSPPLPSSLFCLLCHCQFERETKPNFKTTTDKNSNSRISTSLIG